MPVGTAAQISEGGSSVPRDDYAVERLPESAPCKDIQDIISQLVRISVAISRSSAQARLNRADQSFDPDSYDDFRGYLSTLVFVGSLPPEDREAGNLALSRRPPILTEVQRRLVEANLRRHHRFSWARRRWAKQSAEREESIEKEDRHDEHGPSDPTPRHSRPEPRTDQGDTSQAAKRDTKGAATITSSMPSALEGSVIIPRGSQPSMTVASSTRLRADYPKPPRTAKDESVFQCPCCCQTLPISTAKSEARWRYV